MDKLSIMIGIFALGIAVGITLSKNNKEIYDIENQNKIRNCFIKRLVESNDYNGHEASFESGWFAAHDCYNVPGPKG